MKKIISMLLALVMVVMIVPVLADGEVSEAMKTALINVKSRVDIPDNFTEFSPHSYEENGKIRYTFKWSTEDGNAYITVLCDEKGRITRYSINDNSVRYVKKLTALSKADIIKFADDFLKKAIPEGFVSETDCLVYDENSWGADGNSYTVGYDRICLDRKVKDNTVFIRIYVHNDVPTVNRMDAEYNYDGVFSTEDILELNTDKYKEAFPVELIYRDVYTYAEEDENKTVLVYRNKDNEAGFMSALNYEVIEEDAENSLLYSDATGGGVSKNEAAMDFGLTEKELEQIKNVEGLISKEESDGILRKLPSVKLDTEMELTSYSIQKRDEEYFVSIRYNSKDEENYRYLNATLNASTGKVLSLYSGGNNDYDGKELTNTQKETASKKIDEFINAVAKEELQSCKEHKSDNYGSAYTKNFDRYVNDIRYIDDGIDVSYNVKSETITNYRLDFENDKIFERPENVITAEEGYNALLKFAPIENMWVMSGGVYIPCWTIEKYGTEIDAFTGEEYEENTYIEPQEYNYEDIKGHWAEEKINKLAEIQIGLSGENFYPDAPITQYDLLRLFGAGVKYQSYLTYSEDLLYENMFYHEILTKEEKNPQGQVLREDAFVYMIRLDGIEKVAKLSNIFTVEYADENLLSEGKIGYPSILTGMNIICGNGGYLKPKTPITRAEAIVMVYNYLINQ